MDKRGQALGWVGLIGGGVASVAGNVRSLWIPAYVETGWRDLPERAPQDAGAFVMAVFLPLAALVGVEMVNHWTHLHRALRFGVLGMVSFAALASSFVHVVTVFMWYGQPAYLAVLGTLAVDGIMILSGLALFTRPTVRPDTDTVVRTWTAAPDMSSLDADKPEPLSEVDKAVLSSPVPDSVPDMDTLPAAPIMVPAPRRSRPDPAWKADALDMIRRGEPASDREIAEKILADQPETWPTVEAGRKAVARLRTAA